MGTVSSNLILSAKINEWPLEAAHLFCDELELTGFAARKTTVMFGEVRRNSGEACFCQNKQTKEWSDISSSPPKKIRSEAVSFFVFTPIVNIFT
jgi:hypothetical protein